MIARYNTIVLPGYRVGDDGSVSRYVKRRKAWRSLRITAEGNVCVIRGGKNTTLAVGRLVLYAFAPGARGIAERVLHFPDPDPRNNRLDNLRWAPANAHRSGDPAMVEYGCRSRSGERSRVMTDAQATEALGMLAAGIIAEEVAETLGVHRGVIDRLIAGSYPHLPRPDGIAPIGTRRLRGAAHPCARSALTSTLYDLPRVAIDDHIYCALRRRDVVVVSLSATGWPMTRERERTGRAGYVICAELVEAILNESFTDVAEMLGVSATAVQRWRRRLAPTA